MAVDLDIDGKTRVAVHLAYPSDHVRTPQFLNRRCRDRGLNAVLVPWQVAPENLANVLNGLRDCESLAGVVVTVPHKHSVAALCERLEDDAAHLRAVNAVKLTAAKEFVGRNFDGEGFIRGLREKGIEAKGMRALIIGAGGAGTAVAFSLARAGVGRLTIANRTSTKAENLARIVSDAIGEIDVRVGPPHPAEHDLIVNSTSLGMHAGDALPCDPRSITRDMIVAETVMQPSITPLLVAARQRSARIHLGEHMITAQIDLLIDFVFGAAEATRKSLDATPESGTPAPAAGV